MNEARQDNYAALEYVKQFKTKPRNSNRKKDMWDWTIAEAEIYERQGDSSLTNEERSYYKTPQARDLEELAQQIDKEARGRRV